MGCNNVLNELIKLFDCNKYLDVQLNNLKDVMHFVTNKNYYIF